MGHSEIFFVNNVTIIRIIDDESRNQDMRVLLRENLENRRKGLTSV